MFVLCVVETFFDREQDQTMCRVVRPLQVFESQDAAETAYGIFWPFYDDLSEHIRIVEEGLLHTVFR